jgi:hypothetical protein
VKISASDSPVSSGASVALNRFSRLWRHGTGYSVIGEPGQIPAITLDGRLNGAALDLECLRRCSHVVSVPRELDPGWRLEGRTHGPARQFQELCRPQTTWSTDLLMASCTQLRVRAACVVGCVLGYPDGNGHAAKTGQLDWSKRTMNRSPSRSQAIKKRKSAP